MVAHGRQLYSFLHFYKFEIFHQSTLNKTQETLKHVGQQPDTLVGMQRVSYVLAFDFKV